MIRVGVKEGVEKALNTLEAIGKRGKDSLGYPEARKAGKAVVEEAWERKGAKGIEPEGVRV